MRIGDKRTTLEFREIVAFIDASYWPSIEDATASESEMNEKTPSEDIYGWFRTQRRPASALSSNAPLLSDRRVAEAKAVARRAWVNSI